MQDIVIRPYVDEQRVLVPNEFPKIVTLCGSTRFKKEFEEQQARLTNEGVIVLTVGRFGHLDGLDMGGDLKRRLDELHKRKIDLSDEILVINALRKWCPECQDWYDHTSYDSGRQVCNRHAPLVVGVEWRPYIGVSTRGDIDYAKFKGIPITYLEKGDVNDQNNPTDDSVHG